MASPRTVTRKGHSIQVIDGQTPAWDFWAAYENGWEASTFAVLDDYLSPPAQSPLLFDIGAWVGPITLWAASHNHARVVAVEPDTAALYYLRANIGLLSPPALANIVAVEEAAVVGVPPHPAAADSTGFYPDEVDLVVYRGGDSMSSVTRTFLNPDGSLDTSVTRYPVATTTLPALLSQYGQPTLIKMDIEGGEGPVMAADGPLLRELKIPVLLSLHPSWMTPQHNAALQAEMSQWQVKVIEPLVVLLIP